MVVDFNILCSCMWTLFLMVRMKVLHSGQVGKQSSDGVFVDLSLEWRTVKVESEVFVESPMTDVQAYGVKKMLKR